jgi:hypothetical protein
MLGLLFFGSVITFIFLEYSFLSVTVEKYTDENSLAEFLAFFGGILTIFSFILQTFVADRVIKMYGMKVSLILIPGILGVFAILASFTGTFFGYKAEEPSFILFFLFMAMSKLFLQSLKESFEDPIFKTLFIPLDSSKRFDIQTKIEGFFKEFSGFVAGGLLTLVSLGAFVSLIFYSYFLVIICVLYLFVVIRLFLEYRKTLTLTLTNNNMLIGSETKDYEVTDVLKKELNSNKEQSKIFTLKLLERIEPFMANKKFNEYLVNNESKEIKKFALERIQANMNIESINYIQTLATNEEDELTRKLANQVLVTLKNTEVKELSPNEIYAMAKSRNVKDRLEAARLISNTTSEAFTPTLLILLRDIDPDVRKEAMITAAKTQRSEAWPLLIDYLSSYTFCNVAAAALITFGEKVIPTLESAFYKTNQSATIQEKIVQIYGRIQGQTVIDMLWNKIDFPDKKIVNNVLLCLSSCQFRPNEEQIVRIKRLIENDIGNSAWNIAAISELPNTKETELLKKALEEEIAFNFENIYMLLALIYDPQAIQLVKNNIDSGTVEGLVFAIELLDVFLSDELKPLLFPLIEDIPQSERTERLQSHFPRTKLDNIEVLLQIINRDYNSINKWTKACAIYVYAMLPQTDMCDDLVANLFNPDPLIREVSAWAISRKDYFSFKKNLSRLPESISKELEAKFLPTLYDRDSNLSRIEKIFFLKSIDLFKNVPGVILVEFVELVEVVRIKSGEVLLSKNSNVNSPLYIVVKGRFVSKSEKGDSTTYLEKDLIGENLVLNTDIVTSDIIAVEDSLVFEIDRDRFFEQITDNFEIAREYINFVSTSKYAQEAILN